GSVVTYRWQRCGHGFEERGREGPAAVTRRASGSRRVAIPEQSVDLYSDPIIRDWHPARRPRARAAPPEVLEEARHSFHIGRVTHDGADTRSFDRRGTGRRCHDERRDAHGHRLVELGGDLQLLLLC